MRCRLPPSLPTRPWPEKYTSSSPRASWTTVFSACSTSQGSWGRQVTTSPLVNRSVPGASRACSSFRTLSFTAGSGRSVR